MTATRERSVRYWWATPTQSTSLKYTRWTRACYSPLARTRGLYFLNLNRFHPISTVSIRFPGRFSPTPPAFPSVCPRVSLRLWSLVTGRCVVIFAGENGHRDEVLSADFHLSGSRLVCFLFINLLSFHCLSFLFILLLSLHLPPFSS